MLPASPRRHAEPSLPGFSLFQGSGLLRLALALALSGLIWLAVLSVMQ